MPIIERDPWRMQYFDAVECPDNVVIPTDDEHAYEMFPEHRWIYNKLQISDTQGMAAAPHGVPPASFPVFSKPIYNLHGMGVGGRIVRSADDLESNMLAGHMWTEFLEGEHVSSDVILIGGEAQWWRHTVGVPIGDGVFDYWTVLAEDKPGIESYCGDWFRKHLRGYSGADDRRMGYSVVLFGHHGIEYEKPPADFVREIAARESITSVQITFHDDIPAARHAMPPGGFRLAVINCRDLEAGLRARDDIALSFWSAQNLGPWRTTGT